MSQTLSVQATKRAMESGIRDTPATPIRAVLSERRAARKKLPALIEVPMLDWPADLFNDNATLAELLVGDSPMRWDLPASSLDYYDPEAYIRAAA